MNNSYYMPAEWETHERTFVEWPVKDSMVWPDNYKEVCKGYGEVIQAIAIFEPVSVIVNETDEAYAREICGEGVNYLKIPHDDAWVRDNGPTFVWNQDRNLLGINWKFNAWGEKYLPYDLDDQVASLVLAEMKIPCKNVDIVLEGGSIHVDGEGTLLSTEECLLNINRNPHLTREEIEAVVKSECGVSSIIWLKRGLNGDETDGHVDNIACFAKPGVVILQTCQDKSDLNYHITQENLEILNHSVDAQGRKFEVIEIPGPPIRYYKDELLTLSYLNFYFVNQGIILPVFGGDAVTHDEEAKRILQGLYPERTIVPVDGMALIKEGGNVHCITQQMPKGQ